MRNTIAVAADEILQCARFYYDCTAAYPAGAGRPKPFTDSLIGNFRHTPTMTTKKTSRSALPPKKGFVIYRGIKIAPAEGKRSKVAKIIEEELNRRSQSRSKRTSE
jgi:hypothetical protein